MSFNFPASPTIGQTSLQNGRAYTWTGYAWELVSNVLGVPLHSSAHATGGTDPLAPSDIGAAAASHTHPLSALTQSAATAGQVPVWSGSAWAPSGISAGQVTSGTLDDARLSANVVLYPQFNTALGQPASVVDAISRVFAVGGVTATGNQLLLAFFTPTVTTTVSQISMSTASGAVAAGVTLARMGLYTYPTDGGTATLVARTASDTSLFAATATVYTRSFDATGGYPTTYTLTAGTRYGAAYIVVGTTQPQLVGRVLASSVAALSARVSGASGTQSDLPTSFTPATNSQAPFARFS